MGMFDKLVRKGKQMAGEYVREQLRERSGQGRNQGNGVNDAGRGYGNQGRGSANQNYDGGQGYGGNQNYGGGQGYGGNQNYGGGQGYGQSRQQGYDAGPGYGGRPTAGGSAPGGAPGMSREDQAAIAKYKYMLRTAPPEDMERAHAEAFSRLTPQQRAMLQAELSQELPANEAPRSDRPEDLARAATRAEVSRPGFMEKLLGRGGAGGGRAGMAGGLAAGAAGGLGAGLLAGVAGAFIGTAIAGPLLDGFAGIGEEFAGAAEGLGEGITGAGEEIQAAGEGVAEQGGGLFDGLLGGDGFLGGGGEGFFGDFEA